MAEEFKNEIDVFEDLYKIDVSDRTEKKQSKSGDLTYLSWAHAWAEAKKLYEIDYKIKEWDGKPYLYDDNLGYLVMTEMTIEGQTYEMWLPVMDYHNQAMKAEPYEIQFTNNKITVNPATMMDINKTIMRCLVKNLAMFGLGLYIYAGEDIPENEDGEFVKPPMTKEEAKDIRVTFGKYSGEKLGDIFENDISYLTWLANESNNAEIKNGANSLLDSLNDEEDGKQEKSHDEDFKERLEDVAKKTGKDADVLEKFIFQKMSEELDREVSGIDADNIHYYNKYLRLLEVKAKAKESENVEEPEQSGLFEGSSTKPVDWGN